jgi:hypothetical protein
MVLPDQHKPVQSHHNVRDISAHFECFAEIGQDYYFKELSELSHIDRRTKGLADVLKTAVHRIEKENRAVDAIKNRICLHVLVHVVFQLFFFVPFNSSNHEEI